MKFLIKLLTFWIPVKSWRKKIRLNLQRKLLSKSLIAKLSKKYPDSVFLQSPHAGIGEFIQSLCLMKEVKKKIGKNIVIVTNKKIESQICKLYEQTIDCCFDKDFEPCSSVKMEEKLKVNNIYPMYQLPNKNSAKRKYDIEFLKDFFGLDENAKIEKIKPKRPKDVSDKFLTLENIFKSHKTILLFPDANTYDSTVISDEFWIDIAKELNKKGYHCVFNSPKTFNGFENIFLPLDETVYLSSLADGIISFRSGLSELLAVTTKCKMLVFYPNGTSHLFRKECQVSIDDFKKRIENMPLILRDKNNPVISTFHVGSLSCNFDRDNCKDFYYNFDNAKLFNFVKSEF